MNFADINSAILDFSEHTSGLCYACPSDATGALLAEQEVPDGEGFRAEHVFHLNNGPDVTCDTSTAPHL